MSHPYPLFSLTLSLTKVCCPYPSFSHIYILLHPTISRPYPSISLSHSLSLSLKSLDLIHHSLIYTHSYIHTIMSRPYPSISLSLKSIVHIHQSNTYIHPIMSRPYPSISLSQSLLTLFIILSYIHTLTYTLPCLIPIHRFLSH